MQPGCSWSKLACVNGHCGDVFTQFDHERVEIVRVCGHEAVIAVHCTARGPSMGGVRRTAYPSIAAALTDALLLSRAMTVKSSLAGLPLGGGKSVIVDGSPAADPAVMAAFAEEVDRLGGLYVAAEDIGTTPADMDLIAARTRWVAGGSEELGGSGDPSAATAATVLAAIGHAHRLRTGREDLEGVRVGILGAGKVGSRLAALLARRGARVVVADSDSTRALEVAEATAGIATSVERLPFQELDVLAPCARGGVIDASTLPRLRAGIVCGAANNILQHDRLAEDLAAAGVLYVPDFVANAGGIIQVGGEFLSFSRQRIEATIQGSIDLCAEILAEAAAAGVPPLAVAMGHAQARLRQ